jgi:hypothetical protein
VDPYVGSESGCVCKREVYVSPLIRPTNQPMSDQCAAGYHSIFSTRCQKKQKIKMEAISCLSENFAACFNTFILKGIIQLDNIQKKKKHCLEQRPEYVE